MNDHKPQGVLLQIQKEKQGKGNLSSCHYHRPDLNNPKRMKPTDERVNYQQRYRQQVPIPNANYCSFAKFIPARQVIENSNLFSFECLHYCFECAIFSDESKKECLYNFRLHYYQITSASCRTMLRMFHF